MASWDVACACGEVRGGQAQRGVGDEERARASATVNTLRDSRPSTFAARIERTSQLSACLLVDLSLDCARCSPSPSLRPCEHCSFP